jgi:Flp pilus assembly protein CpaB
MKASTLFVVSIALFVGLSSFAAAKYFGLFGPKGPVEAPVKEEPVMVLVANSDFYPNIAISLNDVRVRELTAEEKSGGFYEKNKGKFLPPVAAAANMRVPNQRIKADTVLMREHFMEGLPDAVTLRLNKGMRAVNVMVPKERAASGVIQLGEYVDVYLTARIPTADGKTMIETAQIARDVRVIMKRGSLYTTMSSDPPGQPMPWGLEANPYRAALIDWAQHKGEITLQPVYHENPLLLVAGRDPGAPISYSDNDSKEYRDEDSRVSDILHGDYRIGDADFARIFNIQPPFMPPLYRVVSISGITPSKVQILDATPPGKNGNAAYSPPAPLGAGPQSQEEKKDCPTCGKKDTGLKDSSTFPPPMGKDPLAMPK